MQVEIRLFGGLRISVDKAPLSIPGNKPQALFAWLAANMSAPSPRDQLAQMFWEDRDETSARTSLRQAIAGLKRTLPDGAVIGTGSTLGLSPGIVTSDVDQFETLLAAKTDDKTHLATTLYRGDLLDGFRCNAPRFDEWLIPERERHRRLALRALRQLLDHSESGSDESVSLCDRLLQIDPLQEDLHRRLMRYYSEKDQAGSALRQFKVCRDALDRELGAPPSPETLGLYNEIRHRGDTPSHNRSASRQAPSTTNRKPLLPSIAVLPFASTSSDPDHEFLADGMTEELINVLAQCVNWRVTARNSSFRYKGQYVDVREVGRELGVAYVVEGSIRKVGDRIRLTAQLINTEDGTHIFSDQYDRSINEIFDLQDELVHTIFRVLKNRIGFSERERIRRTQKANLDAWGLLIKAMQIQVVDDETREAQRELVTDSLAIDPDYDRAHAYLASILLVAVGRGIASEPEADYALGLEHADAALARGHHDPVVLKMCAGGYAAVGHAERAMKLARQAFDITSTPDPLLVALLMWTNQLDEAMKLCEEIVQGMPARMPPAPGELRPIALLGNLHMLKGEYTLALEYTERDLAVNSANYFALCNLANVLGYLDRKTDAAVAWEKAKKIVPALTVKSFQRGYSQVIVEKTLAAKFSDGLIAAGLE